MSHQPQLGTRGPATGARAVVLMLHGGRAAGEMPARRGAAWARMVPFARGVAHATRGREVAVWSLRYRVRGWNEPAQDPVTDGLWALDEARRLHPGAPIVLVGHSMGGRVALRLAGEPDVAGVCALAPWLEPGEPWHDRAKRGPRGHAQPTLRPGTGSVLIAHGDQDRVTDPVASAAYAEQIGASFVPVPGEAHALLRRPVFWQRLVTGFVTTVLETTTHAR